MTTAMDRPEMLAIERQTVFGLPPVEFVRLAADLGCGRIAIVLSGSPYNPHAYEPYSLRDDAGLRRRMTAAMRERGVSLSLGEGFTVRPGSDARVWGAEMAGARGMETTVEFAPSLTVGDLDAALAAVRHVARPDFRLLIDTMHLVRAGHTAADLAAIDPRSRSAHAGAGRRSGPWPSRSLGHGRPVR